MAMMMPQPPRRDRPRGGWVVSLDSTSDDPSRTRSFSRSRLPLRPDSEAPWSPSPLDAFLAEFTELWGRGEAPSIEEYLKRFDPAAPASDAVELIYHAYCLAERAGLDPDPTEYLDRFPTQSESLVRLFSLQRAFNTSQLPSWSDPSLLPEVGDEIGPFVLLRVLGEGGFARVFLAEQSDLDHRLVVLKVSTRITPEPRLLARARHSHIVEVLWHSLIDDGTLQLISMPFLGGATLSELLADRKRRGDRPRTGLDLLAELDRVSAREYPAAELARPARQILARLSYPMAIAWIVARLAEALDYAYSRGVLHGDVKPSNILLTANGEPMLLDFNLAVGWQLSDDDDLPGDTGGTLAYMAPERLRAVARLGESPISSAADRHRADLYALGMVLIEALAGRTPDHPRGSPRSPRELAVALARSRQQGGEPLLRSSRVAIAPALRSILIRCLAADPADRYNRASELAEDLDRWCSERQLTFAREPHWVYGLHRWVRRRRLAVAAAVLSLLVGAACTLAVWNVVQTSMREKALAKLALLWDGTESKAFRFRQFGHWRIEEHDAPEEAFRNLAHYHVVGPGDWRDSDEFRALPESERPELEIWLLEQALRLGRAFAQRPDSPEDWGRGLEILERLLALRPLGPLETQRRLLRRQLGLAESSSSVELARVVDPPPRWMEEYLLGVEAEPLRAKDALTHYRNVLRERPESFWGHYRAATVAHRLLDSAAASDHLEHCIVRRPENPALRSQLAGCLYDQRRYDAALEQCNKALTLEPDHAESFRTRAFIRGRLGQGEGLRTDIDRFELLTRRMGKVPSWRLRLERIFVQEEKEEVGTIDQILGGSDLPRRILTADPEDVDLRAALAMLLQRMGQEDAALAEYNKILEINPDHLRARYSRGGLLYNSDRDEADDDFAYLMVHPRFEELLRESDQAFHTFYYASWVLVRRGETEKAMQIALRGLACAREIKSEELQGEMHYALARIHVVGAKPHSERLQKVAGFLFNASLYDPEYLGSRWFLGDPIFSDQRNEIERQVSRLRDNFD